MFDKVKMGFAKISALTPKFLAKKKVRESMQVIRLYALLVFLLILLFIGGWGWNAYISGKFDLPIFNSFFANLISPAGVATITLISVFLIDKNHDGRPDAGENKISTEMKKVGDICATKQSTRDDKGL